MHPIVQDPNDRLLAEIKSLSKDLRSKNYDKIMIAAERIHKTLENKKPEQLSPKLLAIKKRVAAFVAYDKLSNPDRGLSDGVR